MSSSTQYVFQKRGDNAKKVVKFVQSQLESQGYQSSLVLSSTIDNETISIETTRPLSQIEETVIQTIVQSYVPNASIVPITVNSTSTIRVSQKTDVNFDFRTVEEAIDFVTNEFPDSTRKTTIIINGGTYTVPTTLIIPSGVNMESSGHVEIIVPNVIINGQVSITDIDFVGTSLEPTITISPGSDVLLSYCTIVHQSPSTSGTLAILQMTNSLSLTSNCSITGFTNGVTTSGVLQLTNVRIHSITQTGIRVNHFGQLFVSNMSILNATTGIIIDRGISKLSSSQITACQKGIVVLPSGTPTLTLSSMTFTGNTDLDMDIEATKESNSTIIVNGCILDHNKLGNTNSVPVTWNSIGLTSAGYRHVFSGDMAIGITNSNTRLIVGQGEVLTSLYSVSVQSTLITINSSVPYQALHVQIPDSLFSFQPSIQYRTNNNVWINAPYMIISSKEIKRQVSGLLDTATSRDYYIMLGNIPTEQWSYSLRIIVPNNITLPSSVIVTPIGNSIVVSEQGIQLFIGSAQPTRKISLYQHTNSSWYIFKSSVATTVPWLSSYCIEDDADISLPVLLKWKYTSKVPIANTQWQLKVSESNIFNATPSFTRQPLDLVSAVVLSSAPKVIQANQVITEELSVMAPVGANVLLLELSPQLPNLGDILLLSVSVEYKAFRG